MAVVRSQILAMSKRLFSGTPISYRPPCCVSSPQFTDKFSFLDTVDDSPWPANDPNHWHVFIKKSCLKVDATEQEKMDFYVKTAAQVVGSEEEARERIYKTTTPDCSFSAFGFEMGFDAANEFRYVDGVDSTDLDCTGREYMDGEFIRWSLKPQRREKGRFPLPKPEIRLPSECDCGEYDET